MNKTNIRFSPHILKRLGEELNPDLTQGLIELVKNSYDADARNCTIELINIFNSPMDIFGKPRIIIKDDGEGMAGDDIANNWLLLGESTKRSMNKTSLGRVQVGDKGLGRLAALRLGKKITLKTVSRQNPYIQYQLEMNWNDYDNVKAVEDVRLEIKQESLLQEKTSGTEIIIDEINREISKQEIEKFARALVLLAYPFTNDPLGFKPVLRINEFKELEKLVEQRYFQDAEFHLIATIKNNHIYIIIQDWLGNTIYTANQENIFSEIINYSIPETVFELWIFDFESDTFSTRSGIKTNVKKWLEDFGGVHLYYNQLRVLPYGDKEEQWLSSNLKRITGNKKNTNLIGRLLITDTINQLQQTTDRHGFVENNSFIGLKKFAAVIFDWMAKRWQEEQRKKEQTKREREKNEENELKDELDDAIDDISNEEEKTRVKKAYKNRERYYINKINKLKEELQLYRTLSTTGITAAVFAHESISNPLKIIGTSIGTIENRSKKYLKEDIYNEKLDKPIQRIKNSTNSLNTLSNVALSLINYEKRRKVKLNIHEVINSTIELFSSFIKDRDTQIKTEFTNQPIYFYGSEAALESVIVNLFNNSLVAFEGKILKQRIIIIRTEVVEYYKYNAKQAVEIHVLDNGTGIQSIDINDIWLPGETTTKNGTGLGLTIVRDTIQDMGGKVAAIAKTEELDGAEIIITIPILGETNYG
jgi:signal transduction histidine kinase